MNPKHELALKLQADAFYLLNDLEIVNTECNAAWVANKNYDVGLLVERGQFLVRQLEEMKQHIIRNSASA